MTRGDRTRLRVGYDEGGQLTEAVRRKPYSAALFDEIEADQGSDPADGARLLRRFLQHNVETRIRRWLLAGNVEDGSTITVTEIGGKFVTWANPTAAATSSDDPTEGVSS